MNTQAFEEGLAQIHAEEAARTETHAVLEASVRKAVSDDFIRSMSAVFLRARSKPPADAIADIRACIHEALDTVVEAQKPAVKELIVAEAVKRLDAQEMSLLGEALKS
jgi:hypothetical protein